MLQIYLFIFFQILFIANENVDCKNYKIVKIINTVVLEIKRAP